MLKKGIKFRTIFDEWKILLKNEEDILDCYIWKAENKQKQPVKTTCGFSLELHLIGGEGAKKQTGILDVVQKVDSH